MKNVFAPWYLGVEMVQMAAEAQAVIASPVAGSVAVSPELEVFSEPFGSVAGRGGWPAAPSKRWAGPARWAACPP